MIDKFNDNYLKKKGINAHMVKDDFNCCPWSRYDIYNGDTITIRSKDGRKVIDTGMTPSEFFEEYGTQSKDRNRERNYE